MKTPLHMLYRSMLVCFALIASTGTFAQINYSENFEGTSATWEDDDFEITDEDPCAGNGALRGNAYMSFFGPITALAVSPGVGVSSGMPVTMSYKYKLVEYGSPPFTAQANTPAWGNVQVQYSYSATGPWMPIETITPANHTVSVSCATRTATFTPAAGNTVYVRFLASPNVAAEPDYYLYVDDLTLTQPAAPACSGLPAVSSTVTSTLMTCSTNNSVTLSLNPTYASTGLTFQWQSSADGTTFNNVPSGGTSANYTATQTATTWYRAKVSCGADFIYSSAVQVTSSTLPCLCDIVFDSDIEPISRVNFAGMNNITPADINGTPGVEKFMSQSLNVTPGQTYPIILEGNTNDPFGDGYETFFTVYIDWNHDGDLVDAGESYQIGSITFSDGTDGVQATGNITVPANAMPGLTYMRVFKLFDAFPDSPCSAEAGDGYGQAEDYLLNVQSAATVDWANVQWPATININAGESGTVYAQVYEPGVTEAAGAAPGLSAWIGISSSNTNPSTWTTWVPAIYNTSATPGNNDEYMATIGANLAPGTYYYASRFQLNNGSYVYGGLNGIWNNATSMSGVLTVNCATAAPAADALQTVCAGSTVADLDAAGDAIVWYTAATGGSAVANTTVVTDGTVYYAAQIPAGGCESTTRTAVTAEVITTSAPTVNNDVQIFCGTGATVSNLSANGNNVQWYSAASGGTAISPATALVDGSVYYASQTADGCESASRTAVTVDIVNVNSPTVDETTQMFCNSGTVDDLEADADGDGAVIWYSSVTGGTALDEDTVLIDGATYYAAQAASGCESTTRTAVTVVINITPVPTGDATQEYIHTDEMPFMMPFSDLDVQTVDGAVVTWYMNEEDAANSENGQSENAAFTQSGTYYVTQTINGCESEPFAVTVDVTMGAESFEAGSFDFYPNPVNDVLNISYKEVISVIEVYNLLGQQVMHKDVNQTNVQVNMATLIAGAYLVKVSSASSSKTIKIIKG